MRKITNRKAVSPVIATVILVAVAITVSVAVSYWMSGISAQYTQFEKVEIQTGYSAKDASGWQLILELKNSGSAAATISTVFINEGPLNATDASPTGYGASTYDAAQGIVCDVPLTGLTLQSGETGAIIVYLNDGYQFFSSGTTVDIKLHSANGNDYIKLIKLV